MDTNIKQQFLKVVLVIKSEKIVLARKFFLQSL